MIDAAVFVAEMEMLQQRFGYARDFTPEFLERYRDYLSAYMTTEEFTAAARTVFEEHDTWPSPKRFREALTGDPRRVAEAAWTDLNRLAANGVYPELEKSPEPLRAALKAAPFREIMYADEYQRRILKRDFLDAYLTAADPNPRRLPAAED